MTLSNNQMELKVLQERKPYILPRPNADELFSSKEWRNAQIGLPIMLGQSPEGTIQMMDLSKAPHLLVAGATGRGTSVFAHQLLLSLLLRFPPDELKLLLIDWGALDFALYEKLPHLVAPVLTEPEKVVKALQWANQEMNRRYQWLAAASVRNIYDYNTRTSSADTVCDKKGNPIPDRIPPLVIVIIEFADLMIGNMGEEFERSLVSLAGKSRAVGIHIVAMTQRVSEYVLTGVLKANFPVRIAFRVADKEDSLDILEQEGAEFLRGRGDMLYSTGANACERLQCGYVSSDEIASTANACAVQREAEFDEDLMKALEVAPQEKVEEQGASDCSQLSYEELVRRALAVIETTKRPTIANLQRQLHLGYNQSCALLEKLEKLGYVGPQSIKRPRKIHWDKLPSDIVSEK